LYLINIPKKEKLNVEDALCETVKAMNLKSFSNFVEKKQKWNMDKASNHIKNVFKLKVKLSFELQKSGGRVA